jgi:hypothetical protein
MNEAQSIWGTRGAHPRDPLLSALLVILVGGHKKFG